MRGSVLIGGHMIDLARLKRECFVLCIFGAASAITLAACSEEDAGGDAGDAGQASDIGEAYAGDANPPGSLDSGVSSSLTDSGTRSPDAVMSIDAEAVRDGGGPTTADAGADATASDAGANTRTPMPAEYAPKGPYGPVRMLLNQAPGTVTTGTQSLVPLGNSNDPSAFTLFYPEAGAREERLPLLTWGDGTFTSPTFYEALLNHIASYGFIVVATNSADVGTGKEMLQAVDWALAQNEKPDSPIYGRIDSKRIGALGHSQGGSGTVMAGADPRVRAIAPLSGAPLSDRQAASERVQCPAFYMTTPGDVATPEEIRAAHNETKTPTVFGVTKAGDHDEYADVEDDPGGVLSLAGLTSNDGKQTRAAIAAWFDWQLKGKEELRPLFLGPSCGFCRDANNWSVFESKGF